MMMDRGARILLGRNILDGCFEAFETFFEFAFAVNRGKGYPQKVLLSRLAYREPTGMQYGYAATAEELFGLRPRKR